jgi:RNA polymerase sigma factor (TIGR02999 family)
VQERQGDGLTRYLEALGRGETANGPEAVLFEELRAIAEAYLRTARAGVTLQPTVLVHEAYLKLFERTRAGWNDRAHFFAVAARAMRQILVDRARASASQKRGGARERITLDERAELSSAREMDLLELDDALAELAKRDERAARVVELRFFAGLEMEEVAAALSISLSTAEREWRAARAWLGARLDPASGA